MKWKFRRRFPVWGLALIAGLFAWSGWSRLRPEPLPVLLLDTGISDRGLLEEALDAWPSLLVKPSLGQLRVAYWNVGEAGATSVKLEESGLGVHPLRENLTRWVRDFRTRPEVLILEEWIPERIDPTLVSTLQEVYSYELPFVPGNETLHYGTKVYSSLPLSQMRVEELPYWPEHFSATQALRYRNIWLRRAPYAERRFPRRLLSFEVTLEMKDQQKAQVWIATAHLANPWAALEKDLGLVQTTQVLLRAKEHPPGNQVARSMKLLSERMGAPGVFLGDLNIPRQVLGVVPSALKQISMVYLDTERPTYPTHGARYVKIAGESLPVRIDQAYATLSIEVVGSYSPRLAGSDHYPIVHALRVRSESRP